MKLVGTKDKGYKLVSSFEQAKAKKPDKSEKPENTTTPPSGGTTDPK